MGVIALAMVVPAVLFRESVRATKKSLVSVWQYAMIFFLTLTSDFAFGLCATFLDLLVMAQDGSCGRYMKSGSCLEVGRCQPNIKYCQRSPLTTHVLLVA